MAETIFKAPTGSVGPDGTPIFDVFEGTRKLELPEFQTRGLNLEQIQQGIAPTGFTSQFQPVELKVADKIPAEVLEDKTTSTDLQKLITENITTARTRAAEVAKTLLPTERETALKKQLGEFDIQTQVRQEQIGRQPIIQQIAVGQQAVDERLRELTRLGIVGELGLEQTKRQAQFDVLKFELDQGRAETDDLFKLEGMVRQQKQDAEATKKALTTEQRSTLDTIVANYTGLTFDELDPASRQKITQLAQQLGIPIQSVANDLQNDKNELEFKNLKTKADIARTRQLTAKGTGIDEDTTGEIDSFARRVNSGELKLSNVPSDIRGQVSIKAKEFVGDELREEIVTGQAQGFNREKIIDSLAPAYPEFSKQEIRDQVFDLIPDKPQEDQPEKQGALGGFFNRLFSF